MGALLTHAEQHLIDPKSIEFSINILRKTNYCSQKMFPRRVIAAVPRVSTSPSSRLLHTTPRALFASNPGAVPDDLANNPVKGRTGGGEPLDSSAPYGASQPKVSNHSVPGHNGVKNMSPEQKKEVEEHNKDFEAKHDTSSPAPEDKVDKKFWTGEAQGKKGVSG